MIADYEHWCVLARPAQPTLGAMVLVCKDNATSFAAISATAFSELGAVIADVETASKKFRRWNKINYLMLMMVDPDVHFHVLPRYDEAQEFDGTTYPDPGWPGAPDLASAIALSAEQINVLARSLKAVWPQQN